MVNATTEPTRSTTDSDHASETASRVANTAAEFGQDAARHYVKEPAQDLLGLAKSYAKDNPDVAACWAFGLGILVGWKLKP
ncbi:hypothetical protein LF1_40250 [Rubripirellula obstinata]|uniref:DUF883 domain-containing protein n=1 Tax=Rubripirellula obstinata TaxID=406547 RepID=A0A5B1CNG3_9BACT|nr:hypothetical protein [Rubripirellula obstinata]KAA1261475.1 hypothetical protein LF1_40250 [Rubripirellula obstinata]